MPLKPINPLDTPGDVQGDDDWRGFRSQPAATALPPGIDRFAQNMRYERNYKRPRAGSKAMSTDIVLANPPAVLDFDLPTEYAVFSVVRTGATVRVSLVSATNPASWAVADVIGLEGATQTAYNGDWAVTAIGVAGGHWYFEFSIGAATPATPATGTIVAARGIRIFEVYSDRARAACVYADDDNTEHILVASGRSAWVMTEGAASMEIAYPVGEVIATDAPADLVPHLGKIYLFRGRAAGPVLTITSITRAGATVTVTTAANHLLTSNDWFRLLDALAEDYRGVWQITVTGVTTFTFNIGVAVPVSPAATPGTGFKVAPPMQWDRNTANDFVIVTTGGAPEPLHMRMAPADWAVPYNDQLWLPLQRDQLIASDFNEANVYDTQTLQRFKAGSADWLVNVYPGPLTDEPGAIGPRLLVMLRKSLFLLYLNPTTLGISAKKQIPGAEGIGCRARKSVATCGEYIAWLSDQGVQLAALGRELTLLTLRQPLSAHIQDLIDRINWPVADQAVGHFLNNRYFLAAPIDDSEVNNALFVFNFLSTSQDAPFGEWESLDVYPGDFDIVSLLVMAYAGRQRLHAVTSAGYAYALEVGSQDEYGSPGGALGSYDIEGRALGRRLIFGSLETKKFVAVRVDLELEAGARVLVDFTTTNPDRSRTLKDITATAPGDETVSKRPKMRGISGAIDLILPNGRPIIKTVTIEAVGGAANTRDKE